MTSEKLTAYERRACEHFPGTAAQKLLRIHDSQAAALERVRAWYRHWRLMFEGEADAAFDDLYTALSPAPAQAAEPNNPSGMSVKELCEAYDRERALQVVTLQYLTAKSDKLEAAEARCAELERELETQPCTCTTPGQTAVLKAMAELRIIQTGSIVQWGDPTVAIHAELARRESE